MGNVVATRTGSAVSVRGISKSERKGCRDGDTIPINQLLAVVVLLVPTSTAVLLVLLLVVPLLVYYATDD